MQVFYAILAMMLITLLSLTVMRSNQQMESRMVVNEVATQATGVAVEIIEAIGRRPFDAKTDSTIITTFPLVTNANQLTEEPDFGGCTTFSACGDIDDYDGMTVTRSINDFVYTATITVKYVDEANPDTYTGYETFAKEVLVEVSSPYLRFGTNASPLTVPFRRIFSYQRTTSI